MTRSHLHVYFIIVSKEAHCMPTENPDTFQAFLLFYPVSGLDVFFHLILVWGKGRRGYGRAWWGLNILWWWCCLSSCAGIVILCRLGTYSRLWDATHISLDDPYIVHCRSIIGSEWSRWNSPVQRWKGSWTSKDSGDSYVASSPTMCRVTRLQTNSLTASDQLLLYF